MFLQTCLLQIFQNPPRVHATHDVKVYFTFVNALLCFAVGKFTPFLSFILVFGGLLICLELSVLFIVVSGQCDSQVKYCSHVFFSLHNSVSFFGPSTSRPRLCSTPTPTTLSHSFHIIAGLAFATLHSPEQHPSQFLIRLQEQVRSPGFMGLVETRVYTPLRTQSASLTERRPTWSFSVPLLSFGMGNCLDWPLRTVSPCCCTLPFSASFIALVLATVALATWKQTVLLHRWCIVFCSCFCLFYCKCSWQCKKHAPNY